MELKTNSGGRTILIILYTIFIVVLIGHLIEPLRDSMIVVTPFILLLTGVLVLYKVLQRDRDLIQWIIIVYIVIFSMKVFGVKTGLIFGSYVYEDILGPTIWDTPLLIVFNWVLIIMGTAVLLKKNIPIGFLVIILAPVLIVIYDFFLEPVAMRLGYWNWIGGGGIVPLQNYLAWSAIAMLAVFYFVILKIEIKSNLPVHYIGIQTVFFIILNFTL